MAPRVVLHCRKKFLIRLSRKQTELPILLIFLFSLFLILRLGMLRYSSALCVLVNKFSVVLYDYGYIQIGCVFFLR